MAAKVNDFHTSLERIKIQNKENLNRYLINLDNAKCVLYSKNEENKAFAKEMELYVQSFLINVASNVQDMKVLYYCLAAFTMIVK